MKRTLGELVDRLITTDFKLWFVQDKVHLAAKTNRGLDAETTKRLNDLNLERNRLMTALDECLDESIKEGKADIDYRHKLT